MVGGDGGSEKMDGRGERGREDRRETEKNLRLGKNGGVGRGAGVCLRGRGRGRENM